MLVFTVLLAAWEDIFYVGYLQTRLYGMFKKDVIAILIGAVLFALPHLPMGLVMMEDIGMGWAYMVFAWLIGHVFSVLLFRRYFFIFHVIIWHTFSNFLPRGDFWNVYNYDYNLSWIMTTPLVIFLPLIVIEIVRYIRAKKANTTNVHLE